MKHVPVRNPYPFRMASEESILTAIQGLSRRFESLTEEVETLKKEHSSCRHSAEDRGSSSSQRERSRSPHRRGESSHNTSTPRSWAGRMERNSEERPNYSADLPLLDASEQAEDADGPDLVEVSEETAQFLTRACSRGLSNTRACSRGLSNETRKQSRRRFPLPKVPATRCPSLDAFMKPEVSQPAKTLDKELAIVQPLAPFTTLVEYDDDLSPEAVKDAASTAIVLIGNSNARLSRLRRERILTIII